MYPKMNSHFGVGYQTSRLATMSHYLPPFRTFDEYFLTLVSEILVLQFRLVLL